MRVLITGGGGFVGSYFVRKLIADGQTPVVFDLYPPSGKLDDVVEYIVGDIRDHQQMVDACKGCDRVLHLAAAHHDFGISDATFQSVNVEGAKTLCDAMNEVGITKLCFYSSVAVFGDAEEPKSEETKPLPNNPYGLNKLAAEHVFKAWADDKLGRKCLVIRPTVTFGPGNYANMFSLIKQIDSGFYFHVGGSNLKSLSYVENLVSATLCMWKQMEASDKCFEFYNYVCKPDLTSREIAECIAEALGKKMLPFSVPFWLARIGALPFDVVSWATGRNLPISTARLRKLAVDQTKFESQKIRDQGYEQERSLTDGIRQMVDWYEQEGKEFGTREIKHRIPQEQAGRLV